MEDTTTQPTKEETQVVASTKSEEPTLLQCRFYEQRFPEIDELVMVNVRSIADMGAYVSLLEYNGFRRSLRQWDRTLSNNYTNSIRK